MKGAKTGGRKAGTPSKSKAVVYSDELAEILCERLASTTDTLTEICKEPGMPSVCSVFNWTREKPEFAQRFREAEERHARRCFDEALRVAKDRSDDSEIVNGKLQANNARVQRDRLICDV
jgi:hypothetical protein